MNPPSALIDAQEPLSAAASGFGRAAAAQRDARAIEEPQQVDVTA